MPAEPAIALFIGGPRDGSLCPLPERWSHRILVPALQRISVADRLPEGGTFREERIHIYEWARFPAGWPKSQYTPFIHRGVE